MPQLFSLDTLRMDNFLCVLFSIISVAVLSNGFFVRKRVCLCGYLRRFSFSKTGCYARIFSDIGDFCRPYL